MSVIDRISAIQIVSGNYMEDDPYYVGESRVVEPTHEDDGWEVMKHENPYLPANLQRDNFSTTEEVRKFLREMLESDPVAETILREWDSFREEIPEGKASVFVWKNHNYIP
jgi:hypothetical protein